MRQHFSEHFRPTDDEKKQIWTEGIFVFDTNVLLNFYRVSRETSAAMFEVLKALKGRLFIPHQVGVEFFRTREGEIAKQVNAFEQVRQHLRALPGEFKKVFSRHPCIPIEAVEKSLGQWAEEQSRVVTECQRANQLNYLAHDDPILPQLDELFRGCCGGPCEEAEEEELTKKVDERVQKNLPPCWVPATAKGGNSPAGNPHAGDGRVWFQVVRYAGEGKKPIVFVTGDMKPNWWRTAKLGNGEQHIGPHFDLIREIESASGNRFLMYTQETFLTEAPKYLGIEEQKKAAEEVKQLQGETEKPRPDSRPLIDFYTDALRRSYLGPEAAAAYAAAEARQAQYERQVNELVKHLLAANPNAQVPNLDRLVEAVHRQELLGKGLAPIRDLQHLLQHLRANGVIPESPPLNSPQAPVIAPSDMPRPTADADDDRPGA